MVKGVVTTGLVRARLAQSVEHQTFNLRVKGSSPLLGVFFFFFFFLFFFFFFFFFLIFIFYFILLFVFSRSKRFESLLGDAIAIAVTMWTILFESLILSCTIIIIVVIVSDHGCVLF